MMYWKKNTGTRVKDITARESRNIVSREEITIIDVRTRSEHMESSIPGSRLMDINSGDFAEKAKNLDKEKKYLVYCRTGKRSRRAVDILISIGFKNIFHLKNGIKEWINEGYETK